MFNHFQNDPGNLEQLASLDLLDLCLLGETGTCKTHTAKLIHKLSPRASHPLVSVNCAETFSLLYPVRTVRSREGSIHRCRQFEGGQIRGAAGGTFLLDEIGELDAGLQAKLLKVVEEKGVTRVGENRAHRDLGISRSGFLKNLKRLGN